MVVYSSSMQKINVSMASMGLYMATMGHYSIYVALLGCNMGTGNSAVLWSWVTQVQAQVPNS